MRLWGLILCVILRDFGMYRLYIYFTLLFEIVYLVKIEWYVDFEDLVE